MILIVKESLDFPQPTGRIDNRTNKCDLRFPADGFRSVLKLQINFLADPEPLTEGEFDIGNKVALAGIDQPQQKRVPANDPFSEAPRVPRPSNPLLFPWLSAAAMPPYL